MSRLRYFVIFLIISLLGIFGYFNLSPNPPLVPINLNQASSSQSKVQTNQLVYGFLPFWTLSKVPPHHLDHLTHLAYFSLQVDESGNIIKLDRPGQREPGWHQLNQRAPALHHQARTKGVKLHLVINSLSDETIATLLSSDKAIDTLSKNILELLKEYQFDGVNIDFETTNPASPATAKQFTQFIKVLHRTLNLDSNQYEIVIDIYPSAASRPNLWNLADLEPFTDYFVMMAYDYHHKHSPRAGPVAPLYNLNPRQSIMRHIKEISSQIPSRKLILGIPLYGYQWQTTDDNLISHTYPNTGKFVSYDDILLRLEQAEYIHSWDADTMSARLLGKIDNETIQIHFDSPQSIKFKVELAHQSSLGGIALWALGYHTGYPPIWIPEP
jgi:spore germination protein YaaH